MIWRFNAVHAIPLNVISTPDSDLSRASPLDLALTLPLLFGLLYIPLLLWFELINHEVLNRVIFGFVNKSILAPMGIARRLHEIPETAIVLLAAAPALLALRWMLRMIKVGGQSRV